MSMQTPSPGPRLSDQAYATIRRLIIECRLAPGREISEPELCLMLGQNRAGVRAALLRLAQEKLVQPIPRRGYRVSPLTLQDARDVFELRRMLEPPAAALAAGRLRKVDFAPLDAAFDAGYRREEAPTVAAFLAANRGFRLLVTGAAGNARLVEIVAGLVDESERYISLTLMTWDRSQEMLRGYRALRAAILEDRAAAAEAEARRQVEFARERVMEALLAHEDIARRPIGYAGG
ncbi:GntR family transcriptional regulator [Siccirubricoccus phaeus]|uniref:GntR family transcriptional regulator n=1 Tax=Siccirubricoccus phaeus TaxID=2595053 RepID=UPI00165AE4A1|nr:GntR family transcriptional regulator [Siccirubricoccus phaeus]